MIPWYFLLLLACGFTFLGAFGAYFFKRASEKFSLNPIKLLKNYHFIIAGTLYVIATVAYVAILKFETLTIMYPLTSLQYIWAAVLSYFLLDEKITKHKSLGIGLIIVGIIIIVIMR